MSDHVHVISSDGAISIASEHREWLASEDKPCSLCGARAEENPSDDRLYASDTPLEPFYY